MSRCQDFFNNHLMPNTNDFKSHIRTGLGQQWSGFQAVAFNLKTERLGMNAAVSAFSLRDWMLQEYNGQSQVNGYGPTQPKPYQTFLEGLEPNFEHMRDVCNSHKHLRLNRTQSSTAATSAAATQATVAATVHLQGSAQPIIQLIHRLTIDPGGLNLDFETALDDVINMWQNQPL